MSAPEVIARQDALRAAWQTGALEYVFRNRRQQRDVYREIRGVWAAGTSIIYALTNHRRWGKTRLQCVLGLEECLRAPRTRVVYLTETKLAAERIVIPLILELIQECPERLRPRYFSHKQVFRFPNGSEFTIFGTALDAVEKGRGVGARILLIDEAAQIDNLNKALEVYLPVLGTTGGLCVMASTPPDVEGHPFEEHFLECERRGVGRRIPLSKNPDAPPELHRAADEYRRISGEAAYLREFECIFGVSDNSSIVIPEFTPNRRTVLEAVTYPADADRYVALDIGGRDFHGVLLGAWDYVKRRAVLEDEILIKNIATPDLVAIIRGKELDLWGPDPKGRVLRFGDNNNKQLLLDMHQLHGMRFQPTLKSDKTAQIQAVRSLIANDEIRIHPRCLKLAQTLAEARWNTAFSGYLRPKDGNRGSEIGHADLLDALVYFVRNIRRNHAPAPAPQQQWNVAAGVVAPRKTLDRGRPPSSNAVKLAAHLRKLMGR